MEDNTNSIIASKPTFAQGLKDFNSKGVLYKRSYLSNLTKQLLITAIKNTLSKTCDMDETAFERTMEAMSFLKERLNRKQISPTKSIACTLYFWTIEYDKYNDGFDPARQWVHNLWCRKWAISEIVL